MDSVDNGDMDDIVNQDLDYPSLSEAVRRYSAEKLYKMTEVLEPIVSGLFDRVPESMAYMEPARISAQTQVARLYLSTVRELGDLYRVTQPPVIPEPEVPMIPADQVPLMIEAAVDTAVQLTEERVRLELEAAKAEATRISSDQARSTLTQALARIRQRSS